jgi:hypothetical protein
MDCIIPDCVRNALNEYCERHLNAFENVERGFASWRSAYGKSYTYSKYLERLSEDYEIGSGQWVIEIAEYLLDQKN